MIILACAMDIERKNSIHFVCCYKMGINLKRLTDLKIFGCKLNLKNVIALNFQNFCPGSVGSTAWYYVHRFRTFYNFYN